MGSSISKDDCDFDFEKDWLENLNKELHQKGYPTAKSKDAFTSFKRLQNINLRGITTSPRKVFQSREFKCPEDLKPAFEEIKRKAEKGEDLRPHLSTGIRCTDQEDLMMNDWGIHHFHLSTDPHKKLPDFTDRTNELIFALVANDAIYMIDVFEHNDWADIDAVEILHKNWPQVIEKFLLKKVVKMHWPDGKKPTAEERMKLRKAGINVFIELEDGTFYHPIGFGITSATTPVQTTVLFNACKREFRRINDSILAELEDVVEQMKAKGFQMKPPYKLKFRAFHAQGGSIIREENSNVEFLILPEQPRSLETNAS